MNKPHKHAELIKKWADGATIEVFVKGVGWWELVRTPDWLCDEYRVKPEVTTSLSNDVLCGIYERHVPWPTASGGHSPWFKEAVRAVADAAIKQYIKEQGK